MTRPAPNPFALSIDPRDRLLLFDIADDPTYAALELQVFDDDVQGKGMLVLLQHHDGLVDFYRQPSLNLDREKFSIGRGVGRWRKATIKPDRLLIASDGVQVDVGMRDAEGRRIEIHIDDRDRTPRHRSSLLAPVGSGVEQPHSFFVVLMRGFDLLRTSGEPPRLRIGGEERHIASFPGPARLHRRRFARYSSEPIIVELNPRHDGPLTATAPPGGVSRMEANDGARSASLIFRPTFPNLRALEPSTVVEGEWTLDVADQPALTGGTWGVQRTDNGADLTMAVTKPWRPRGLPLSLRMVTTVARVFRTWPTTYRWAAQLDLDSDPPSMHSAWTRTEKVDRANAYRIPRPTWRSLSGRAKAFRIAHSAWAAVALTALGYIWASAILRRRDRYLFASGAFLSVQGVALAIGRGNCPFGPMQVQLGDPVPLFELVLPPRAAKAAIPVLLVVTLVGLGAAAVRSPR
jgi:hypothetical protein